MNKILHVICLVLVFAVFFCAGTFLDIRGFWAGTEDEPFTNEIKAVPAECRVSDGRLEAKIDGLWTDMGEVSGYVENDILSSYSVDRVPEEYVPSTIGRVKIPVVITYSSENAGSGYSGYVPTQDSYAGGTYTPPSSPSSAQPSSGDGEDMAPVF